MKTSINIYFDKIYLLTIKRNLGRQSLFVKNLAGIDYEIFIGVDGKQLDLEELKKAGEYNENSMSIKTNMLMEKYLGISYLGIPHRNMVACSMSHKAIYQDVINNNYSRVLILEDDALLEEKNIVYWDAIQEQLPNNWDLLYLGYEWKYDETPLTYFKRTYIYPLLNFTRIKKYNAHSIKNGYAKPYSKNLLEAGTHAGTHAYAITRKCAEILLKEQSPVSCNPDLLFWEPAMEKRINAYSCKPRLFITADLSSSIIES